MELVLFLNFTILLLLLYCLINKKLHPLESIFIILIVEFIISTYFAIVTVNKEFIEISNKSYLLILFRVHEVITLPIIILLYFNGYALLKTKIMKWFSNVLIIVLLILIEEVIKYWEGITYLQWNVWRSGLFYIFLVLTTSVLLKAYSTILRKEERNINATS